MVYDYAVSYGTADVKNVTESGDSSGASAEADEGAAISCKSADSAGESVSVLAADAADSVIASGESDPDVSYNVSVCSTGDCGTDKK